MNFRLWAPYAKKEPKMLVWPAGRATSSDAETVALTAQGDGWFVAPTAPVEDGVRYAFDLGDGKRLPDPRSRLQQEGVHGPSTWTNPECFRWEHRDFRPVPWSSAVVYELHIGTFSEAGTFDSAIEKLDHLVDLGVTHVEVMPVATFPGERGWGYDGVDLFAPHPAYGGPDGFARFVDACHGKGLAVMLDVVYNHLGPSGNYLGQFAPYFSSRYNTPWGDAVNFDAPGCDEVRRFVCDNALYWLEHYRLDGLRLDAVHEIYDCSARHVLEQLAEEVEALSAHLARPLVLVAESASNDPRNVRPRQLGGHGLTSQWSDDFHHAIHAALTGERIGYYEDFGRVQDIAEALLHGFVFRGQYSRHRNYSFGRSTEGLWGRHFVFFTQNHDQIGNRARGDRLSTLTSPGRLRIAAALTLLGPGVPLLFMGEEWGTKRPFQYFTHHSDVDLAKAVSRGRRREFSSFGWKERDVPDPQAESTFQASKLDWAEIGAEGRAEHVSMLDFYRRLLELRRSMPALRDDRPDNLAVTFNEQRKWLCMRRGQIIVLCHWGERRHAIALSELPKLEMATPREPVSGLVELLSGSGESSDQDETMVQLRDEAVEMPPDAVVVFRLWRDIP